MLTRLKTSATRLLRSEDGVTMLEYTILIGIITIAVIASVAPTIRSAEMLTRVEKHSQNLDWLVKHPTILKLLELHNRERARNGLPPSTLNAEMCLAAQKHAVWMAETGSFQHSALPYRGGKDRIVISFNSQVVPA